MSSQITKEKSSSSSSTTNDEKTKKLKLHPLAISSVCDHHTRVMLGGSRISSTSPVIGLLFGIQNGLEISIVDASDALYDVDENNNIQFMEEEIKKKIELWTAVFNTYELLGWYTFGSEVSPIFLDIHKTMSAFHQKYFIEGNEKPLCSEVPLFLLMNSSPESKSKQLPLQVFETETYISNENQETSLVFMEIPFELETNQAERIAIDQVTKLIGTDSISSLEVQNQSSSTSLRKLDEKIKILIATLEAMEQNKIPVDHHLLRTAAKLNDFFLTVRPGNFDDEFVDNMIISYLGATTKTTSELATLSDLYHTTFSDRGHYF